MMHETTRSGDDNVGIVSQGGELLVHAVASHQQSHPEVLEFRHLARKRQRLEK